MFKVYDGEKVLDELLKKAGIHDYNALELLPAWQVFKEFVKVPAITKSDGILVQWGAYKRFPQGGEDFQFDFCRQLKEPGEDEYVQIYCRFHYSLDESLKRHSNHHEWWFSDHAISQDEFFAQIESLPVFNTVKLYKPVEMGMGMDCT